jgi:ferredoxin
LKNDINITVIDRNGNQHGVSGPTDMNLNLMELLKIHEFPIEGTCGGMAMCASCHVYIQSNHELPEKSYDEKAMLEESWDCEENSRLSCQLKISESLNGLIMKIAPEQ